MPSLGRFFASRWGPIITGIAVGVLAPILDYPGKVGIGQSRSNNTLRVLWEVSCQRQ